MSALDADVPGIPRGVDGPVFREPWEAQSFAMALALHRAGIFEWREWAAMLAEEIQRAQAAGDPDTGETYYRHWQATLERMVAEKGLTDLAAIARHADAWSHADAAHAARNADRAQARGFRLNRASLDCSHRADARRSALGMRMVRYRYKPATRKFSPHPERGARRSRANSRGTHRSNPSL